MAQVTIFGYSDDLIEVRGDIHDELGAYGGGVFGFDDGTILRADYGDTTGTWRFEVLATGNGSSLVRIHNPQDGDEDDYTERWKREGRATHVFPLPDWKEGDLSPQPQALRAALDGVVRVKVSSTREGHLELHALPKEGHPGGRNMLVLPPAQMLRLLLLALGVQSVNADHLDL